MSETPASENNTEEVSLVQQLCHAVSDDFFLLARLHGEELNADTVKQLSDVEFPRNMGFVLHSEEGAGVFHELEKIVTQWRDAIDQDALDILAADFAGIYLNSAFQTSPSESVWLDEDGLAYQQPMFQVREIYNQHGLKAENWRKRADDDLVNELLFLAHLFSMRNEENEKQTLTTAADFLDEHLLRWLISFAERIAARCDTPFYALLSLYTAYYCDELRDLLAEIMDVKRPTAEEIEERLKPKAQAAEIPVQFMPGATPSW